MSGLSGFPTTQQYCANLQLQVLCRNNYRLLSIAYRLSRRLHSLKLSQPDEALPDDEQQPRLDDGVGRWLITFASANAPSTNLCAHSAFQVANFPEILFPKRLIELWVAQSADYPNAAIHLATPPPVIAGSHDPLLEWAARESKSGLAILVEGSTGGIHRLLAGQAVVCGLHLIDPATSEYDASILVPKLPDLDFVVIEWARRRQGLIVARGNPAKISNIVDLQRSVIGSQPGRRDREVRFCSRNSLPQRASRSKT